MEEEIEFDLQSKIRTTKGLLTQTHEATHTLFIELLNACNHRYSIHNLHTSYVHTSIGYRVTLKSKGEGEKDYEQVKKLKVRTLLL